MITVRVARCTGLMDRDSAFAGKSDPYVQVFDPDGIQKLKTPVIDGDLNPVFPAEKSTVKLQVPRRSSGATQWSDDKFIRFDVFDDDVGTDEFLGRAELSLAKWRKQEVVIETLTLKPRPNEPDKVIRNAKSLGTITVEIEWPARPTAEPPAAKKAASPTSTTQKSTSRNADSTSRREGETRKAAASPTTAAPKPTAPVPVSGTTPVPDAGPRQSPPGQLTLRMVGANGLLDVETFGTSDPKVLVHDTAGKVALKTPAIDGSLDPRWPERESTVTLPVRDRTGMLRLDVVDEDTVGDKPMGSVMLSVADALAYSTLDGDISLPLAPPPNTTSSKLSEAARDGKLGVLLIRVTFAKEVESSEKTSRSVDVTEPGLQQHLIAISGVDGVRLRAQDDDVSVLVRVTARACRTLFGPFSLSLPSASASLTCCCAAVLDQADEIRIDVLDASDSQTDGLPLGSMRESVKGYKELGCGEGPVACELYDAYRRPSGHVRLSIVVPDARAASVPARIEVREARDLRAPVSSAVRAEVRLEDEKRSTRSVRCARASEPVFFGDSFELPSPQGQELKLSVFVDDRELGRANFGKTSSGAAWITIRDRSTDDACGLVYVSWSAPNVDDLADVEKWVVGKTAESVRVVRCRRVRSLPHAPKPPILVAVSEDREAEEQIVFETTVPSKRPIAAWSILGSAKLFAGVRRVDDPDGKWEWRALEDENGKASCRFAVAELEFETCTKGAAADPGDIPSFPRPAPRGLLLSLRDKTGSCAGEVMQVSAGRGAREALPSVIPPDQQQAIVFLPFAHLGDEVEGRHIVVVKSDTQDARSAVRVPIDEPSGSSTLQLAEGTVSIRATWASAADVTPGLRSAVRHVGLRLGSVSAQELLKAQSSRVATLRVEAGSDNFTLPPRRIPIDRDLTFSEQSFHIALDEGVEQVHIFLYAAKDGNTLTSQLASGAALATATLKLPATASHPEASLDGEKVPLRRAGASVGHVEVDVATALGVLPRRKQAPEASQPPTPVRISGAAARPFTTMMGHEEPLSNLQPFLERHFGLAGSCQRLQHRGQNVRWDGTLTRNKCVAENGCVVLAVSHTNRRLLPVEVKTPSGASIPLYPDPSTMVGELKKMLLRAIKRDELDTQLNTDGPLAFDLSYEFRVLEDDEPMSRLKPTAALMAANKRSRQAKPPGTHSKKATRSGAAATGDQRDEESETRIPLRVTVDTSSGPRSAMVQASSTVANLKRILQISSACGLSVDGCSVDDESTLVELGVSKVSRIAAIADSEDGPARLPRDASKRRITVDLEDSAGYVRAVDVDRREAVVMLRQELELDHARFEIFWNGRRVLDEHATFEHLRVREGAHFEVRDPMLRRGADESPTRRESSAAHAATRARIVELASAVSDLELEVKRVKAEQQQERAQHESELRAALDRATIEARRADEAEARIEELDAALRRNQRLLKKAAGFSDPQRELDSSSPPAGTWRPRYSE